MSVKKIWNSIKRYYADLLAVWLVLCMAAGFWGILYPQLTLNADTYRMITESGEQEIEADGTVVYMEMLNADRSQLRFRCRLVEEIKAYLGRVRSMEKEQQINESGDYIRYEPSSHRGL